MPIKRKKPWHEKFPPAGWLRRRMRDALFRFAAKMAETDDGKAIAARTLRGLLPARPAWNPNGSTPEPPYADLGRAATNSSTASRSDIIIVTARFRSGSTLLWNLFRHIEDFTSYYEPLNERRWFDPKTRGSNTDSTHKNAEEYWREYDGLGALAEHFQESWNERHLFMDDDFWEPSLKRYCEIMIEKAPDRPVLQFNRIDFRLPWFRRNFPNAKLVHLYRHPRDQWCSTLMNVECFPHDGAMKNFAPHDKFYLLNWCRDLRYHFPFLDERAAQHPYQLFYYVWKLSYLFGVRYSDHSLAFEDLVGNPDKTLTELFRIVDVPPQSIEALNKIIEKPSFGKWKQYADDAWFRRHEEACETVLAEFFRRI